MEELETDETSLAVEQSRDADGSPVVRLSGELDISNAHTLREIMETVVGSKPGPARLRPQRTSVHGQFRYCRDGVRRQQREDGRAPSCLEHRRDASSRRLVSPRSSDSSHDAARGPVSRRPGIGPERPSLRGRGRGRRPSRGVRRGGPDRHRTGLELGPARRVRPSPSGSSRAPTGSASRSRTTGPVNRCWGHPIPMPRRAAGLQIVSALADGWGVIPRDQAEGKTVWVTISLRVEDASTSRESHESSGTDRRHGPPRRRSGSSGSEGNRISVASPASTAPLRRTPQYCRVGTVDPVGRRR